MARPRLVPKRIIETLLLVYSLNYQTNIFKYLALLWFGSTLIDFNSILRNKCSNVDQGVHLWSQWILKWQKWEMLLRRLCQLHRSSLNYTCSFVLRIMILYNVSLYDGNPTVQHLVMWEMHFGITLRNWSIFESEVPIL